MIAAEVSLNSERARSCLDHRVPRHRRRHHLPEFLQPRHPPGRFVAGDDRGIDGADRDAGDPFRLEARVAERLEGTGLIGAERPAAPEEPAPRCACAGVEAGAGFEVSIRNRSVSERLGAAPWRLFVAASISEMRSLWACPFRKSARTLPDHALGSRGIYRNQVAARMSVQNTLYLVFGA